MVWWGNSWFRRLPFDLQHIPKLFQKITLSSPHHWRIYTCCGLIYILLCMLHIYGVTSVLQTSLFGLPFGSFKTFDFITVPMHSWLHFCGLFQRIEIHDFAQRAVVLIYHCLHVTLVITTSWLSHCAEAFLVDVTIKILDINFSDCGYFWIFNLQITIARSDM